MLEHSGWSVVSPILGLSVNVLVQMASFRFLHDLTLMKSILIGFAAGFLVSLGLEASLALTEISTDAWNAAALLLVNVVTYGVLGYCYFSFIGLGETARRVRLLNELASSVDGLTIPEILERYPAREMVQVRLARLVNNGQVLDHGDRYTIGNPTVLYMSKTIILMKQLLLGQKSELERKLP